LGAAIALMVGTDQYPWTTPWLLAKVVALVLYILTGMIALHSGAGRNVRAIAWIAAQLIFLYIIGVAVTRKVLVVVA
ncbi:MAG: SirB2 family protein, partial [Burkholderiales bacterium]